METSTSFDKLACKLRECGAEHCSKCDACFKDQEIPQQYKHFYSKKHNTHYSRKIYVNMSSSVRSADFFKCPDCLFEWPVY